MDVFIPERLYQQKNNIEKVNNLIEKYFGSDIQTIDDPEMQFFEDLKKLNEPLVYKYLKEEAIW